MSCNQGREGMDIMSMLPEGTMKVICDSLHLREEDVQFLTFPCSSPIYNVIRDCTRADTERNGGGAFYVAFPGSDTFITMTPTSAKRNYPKSRERMTSALTRKFGYERAGRVHASRERRETSFAMDNYDQRSHCAQENRRGRLPSALSLFKSSKRSSSFLGTTKSEILIYVAHICCSHPAHDSESISISSLFVIASDKNGVETCSDAFEKVSKGEVFEKFALYRFAPVNDKLMWIKEGLVPARSPETIFLADEMMDKVLKDVATFLSCEGQDWYRRHGIPYRRNILFHGAPGMGKTSAISVVASVFGLKLCYLTLSDPLVNDRVLQQALMTIPSRSILALEDIDVPFNAGGDQHKGLSIHGVLNALDGITSAEAVVTIMTAKCTDLLEQKFMQSGRINVMYKFSIPTSKVLAQAFRFFFDTASDAHSNKFAKEILLRREGDDAKSFATLHQLFMRHRSSTPEQCINGIPDFFESHDTHFRGWKGASMFT